MAELVDASGLKPAASFIGAYRFDSGSAHHQNNSGGRGVAKISDVGTITARCPGCEGALAAYIWNEKGTANSAFVQSVESARDGRWIFEHRLYRCSGCGRGGLAGLVYPEHPGFPAGVRLKWFYREAAQMLVLPEKVPADLKAEFREAEECLSNKCFRAAAGLFRSVLDKTLRANGYKLKDGTTLAQQIDLAALDGVITASRQRQAHEEIRSLGNDVLHDAWQPITEEDVEPAHRYAQRILEDFYDDRESVLKVLRAKNRLLDGIKKATDTP